ncbi:hypothetical protein F751_0906 [Auxenochlorella protothecoides]|uniref:Glycosyltransferase family 92 protein n=1 Tax=Auxenochlorella protothecoides TaxID=3075 RepID=A0A087SI14_AUXPR|nr:hypothetical protein F751_0906 [Auxenochlorella protothecoides]KFM25368.1 hypothetical protein F751_0906 [Auxenochlorella protothecoides]
MGPRLSANEHRDIVDWATYHEARGIDKIYIIDMGLDSMQPELEKAGLIQSGVVEHRHVSMAAVREDLLKNSGLKIPPNFKQLQAYELCLRDHRHKHRWMAFIDADEYLTVLEPAASLRSILADYEHLGGLGVHWRIFGAAGRIRRPSGRIVEDYHMCCAVRSGEDRHVKSILNTEFAQHFQSVHHANYTGGRVTTNTCGEAIPRYTAAAPCLERLALRHYVTKSLWDFTQKLARGSGMSRRKDWTYFYRVQKMAWQDCRLPAAWPLGRGPVDEGGLGAVTAS